MKETKKCSISGLSFTLENDAWTKLKEYLDSLKKTYADDPDGGEIIADIEARIAELILSTQDNGRVVGLPLILNIIAQLGTAEDISDGSAVEEPLHNAHGEPRIPRRLYRNMEDARLGGVCAGIARYFNVEIPWIRLACCAPLLLIILGESIPFMGWVGHMGFNLLVVVILCYMVMWISVPADRTARQKLEANGEKITVQSIRDASANARNSDVDSKARPVLAETVTVLGRVLIFLLKMFVALIVFVLIVIALALFVGGCIIFFAGGDIFGSMGGSTGDMFMALNNGTLLALFGIATALLPVIILLYVLLSLLVGAKPNRMALVVLFIMWIAAIVSVSVTAIKSKSSYMNMGYTYSHSDSADEYERLYDSIDRAAESYVMPAAEPVVTERSGSEELPSIDID